ncbi:ANTAR domain-containing response regulator [Ponticaulis profundi]|uniref:ANTAR domain-containing response regulator n=1 Tax=Ponticaulis profundi TaxID=2665222 RepID=A0ABW1SCE9_9PROT|tara:strand:- start:65 stop:655 length:591 start_codon:yes stop_codon:yes gene_type:complete
MPLDAAKQKQAYLISLGTENYPLFQLSLPDYQVTEFRDDLSLPLLMVIRHAPDLLIVDCLDLSDDVISCCREIQQNHPVPLIVFAKSGAQDRLQKVVRAGVNACIIDGLLQHRIEGLIAVAVERFKMSREAYAELETARRHLQARKVIERAKGLLMAQRGLQEDEAYQLLRQTAMRTSKPMHEVAESVLTLSGHLI